MNRMITCLIAGIVIGWVLNAFLTVKGILEQSAKVHVLEKPLVLFFEDGTKVKLPPETSLYFERSFPEGFSRYSVHVNIEGEPLETQKTRTREIVPITAAFDE